MTDRNRRGVGKNARREETTGGDDGTGRSCHGRHARHRRGDSKALQAAGYKVAANYHRQ